MPSGALGVLAEDLDAEREALQAAVELPCGLSVLTSARNGASPRSEGLTMEACVCIYIYIYTHNYTYFVSYVSMHINCFLVIYMYMYVYIYVQINR